MSVAVHLIEYGVDVYRDGRVWMPPKLGKDGKNMKGKFVKHPKTTAGYVLITTNNKRMYLHRLIALAYIPYVAGCTEMLLTKEHSFSRDINRVLIKVHHD